MALPELSRYRIEITKRTVRTPTLPILLTLAVLNAACVWDSTVRSTNFPSCDIDPLMKTEYFNLGDYSGKQRRLVVDEVAFVSPKKTVPPRLDIVKAKPGRLSATLGVDESVTFTGLTDKRRYQVRTVSTEYYGNSHRLGVRVDATCPGPKG